MMIENANMYITDSDQAEDSALNEIQLDTKRIANRAGIKVDIIKRDLDQALEGRRGHVSGKDNSMTPEQAQETCTGYSKVGIWFYKLR